MQQRQHSFSKRTVRLRGPVGDNPSQSRRNIRNSDKPVLSKNPGNVASSRTPRLTIVRMERLAQDYLIDGECRFHSKATTTLRKMVIKNLIWFLRNRWLIADDLIAAGGTMEERDQLDVNVKALRGFFAYLRRADARGKWGNPKRVEAAKARTVATYDNHLRSFFAWMKKQGEISVNPLESIEPTVARKSQIAIFTDKDIEALLEAAERSMTGRRDYPMILFMLDTGVRASELCSIKMRDVDWDNRRVTVLGKGNKTRSVNFGRNTSRALFRYLSDGKRKGDGTGVDQDQPLFRGIKGLKPGEAMTPSGLLDAVRSLGKKANIKGVRVSPHTFRHTFATNMIRSGVPAFSLREMLGHTSLHQTQAYVSLVQSDVENQYRAHSPVDKFFG